MPRRLLPQPDDAYHLSKFGYSLSEKRNSRQSSLKAASKKYGTLQVLKRVNLIRNITNSQNENKNKLSSDVKFMKDLFNKQKRSMTRTSSKKSSKKNIRKNKKTVRK